MTGAQQTVLEAAQILGSWAGNFLILSFPPKRQDVNHWTGMELGCLPEEYLGKEWTSFCFSCLLCHLGVDSEGMFSLAGLTHSVLRKQESAFSCYEQWTKSKQRMAISCWRRVGGVSADKCTSFFLCLWGIWGDGKEINHSAGQVKMGFLLFMVLNKKVRSICFVI